MRNRRGNGSRDKFELNAGVIPDPGITYVNMPFNYSVSQLNGPNGNKVPDITGTYSSGWMRTFSITSRSISSSAGI